MDGVYKVMYRLAKKLFPINRSLTGNGVRKTLKMIQEEIPELVIKEVPTGTRCFDWTIPKEWNVKEAYIINPKGQKICDFKENNLHLVGYSIPVNLTLTLEELKTYLFTLQEMPNAIPYVTSYYKERWGFCIAYEEYAKLLDGEYQVCIDSTLEDGFLTYGEMILKGKSDKEILLSTYICHPSMANNEISGPVVQTFIAKMLKKLNREYTYRIIFIPETIGSIMYLSQHYKYMKEKTIAGFVLTCIGDERSYSMLKSIEGNTLADEIALNTLKEITSNYQVYDFKERGSDERQYCSPGIDLPVCNLMKSKYNEYKEYHTSLDNFDVVTEKGLKDGFEFVKRVLLNLEANKIYQTQILCEPQLGRRGLYPTISTPNIQQEIQLISDLIAYSNGKNSLLDISNKTGHSIQELSNLAKELIKTDILVEKVSDKEE